jgi:hypothetical protein
MRNVEADTELYDLSLATIITSPASSFVLMVPENGIGVRERWPIPYLWLSYLLSPLLVTSFIASKNDFEPGVR